MEEQLKQILGDTYGGPSLSFDGKMFVISSHDGRVSGETLHQCIDAYHKKYPPEEIVVNLIYYKDTGKFYASGSFKVAKNMSLGDIWDMVIEMNQKGKLPGLCEGSSNWIISVDVPDHPHNHPHLIFPFR